MREKLSERDRERRERERKRHREIRRVREGVSERIKIRKARTNI